MGSMVSSGARLSDCDLTDTLPPTPPWFLRTTLMWVEGVV
jgi:hypothetical protein